jgi:hypothetical protein
MKKFTLLILATLLAVVGWSQVPQNCPITLIDESFEDAYPPAGWATINTAFTQYTNVASTGSKSIGYGSGSSSYPTYGVATEQITPTLGTVLSFKTRVGSVYAGSASWYTTFRIMVSTTDQLAASFTIIKEYSNFAYAGINSNNVIRANSNSVWQECVADLSDFAGQPI